MAASPAPEPTLPLDWAAWQLESPPDNDRVWNATSCPKCEPLHQSGSLTVLAHRHSGHFHCERCGHHGDASVPPHRYRGRLKFDDRWWYRGPLSETVLAWMAQRGLHTDLVLNEDMSLTQTYFERDNVWRWALAMPCRATPGGDILNVMYLEISGDRVHTGQIRQTPGGRLVPWGLHTVEGSQMVVVSHPMDRLALLQAGVTSVICLPDGLDPQAPNHQAWGFLSEIEERMRGVSRIVFALPDDEAGHALEEELARRFDRERCWRTHWHGLSAPAGQGPVSAQTVLMQHGPDVLLQTVSNPSPYPINGVYELMDVEDRLDALYEFGLQRGALTGWTSVDDHYTVLLGQWTLVTGIPGHGKSTWLDALLVNLAQTHDWRFGLFSPENQPLERHFASLMAKYVGAPFNHGPTPRITPEQKNDSKAWVNEHFKHILPPDDEAGTWSVDGVLKYAKVLVYRYGIRGLVIDPWNELDHTRPSYMSETEHISACLTKIRRFARVHGLHIWVVAHPTKLELKPDGKYPVPTPYNVSGGAHWRNKADNALTIYRNVGEEDENITCLHVQKIRYQEIGKVGVVYLRSERQTGRFFDDLDQDKCKLAVKGNRPILWQEVRRDPSVAPSRSDEEGFAFVDVPSINALNFHERFPADLTDRPLT